MAIAIAVPVGDQQRAIIESCDIATFELDNAIGAAIRELTLIQEFRTRMIGDVVTGKLDVRALAASLPETASQDMIDDPSEDEDLEDLPEATDTEEAAA